MASPMQEPYVGSECKSCNYGTMRVPANGQEWHLVCSECSSILFCYTPLPHQERFHSDGTKYLLYAGGLN